MRLSRHARKWRPEIEEAFQCSEDDEGIAAYFRVPVFEVRAIRMVWDERQSEQTEKFGSDSLRKAIHQLFRNWEQENGFKKGAGELLVPAGYDPLRVAA